MGRTKTVENKESNVKQKNDLFSAITGIIILAISIGLIAIIIYLYRFCWTAKECKLGAMANWGQTGDFFGGILNPSFTLLGLIFVVITINQNQKALKHNEEALQQNKEELELSREELRLSRKEFEKTSQALEAQSQTAKLQQFETTFFNLLSLIKELSPINSSNSKSTLATYLDNSIDERINTSLFKAEFENKKDIAENYLAYIIAILNFIVDTKKKIQDLDEMSYESIINASISASNAKIIFFYCIYYSKDIEINFVTLEKLKSLVLKKLRLNEHHIKLLNNSFSNINS